MLRRTLGLLLILFGMGLPTSHLLAQVMTFTTGATHPGYTITNAGWDPTGVIWPQNPNVNGPHLRITKNTSCWNVTSVTTRPFGFGGGTWRFLSDRGDVFDTQIPTVATVHTLNWTNIKWLQVQLIDPGTGGTNNSFDLDDVVYVEPVYTPATQPTLTIGPGYAGCPGSTATINVSGQLNDADNWVLYTTCNGAPLATTAGTSFLVNPVSTTTYFVNGIDALGCAVPGACGTVTVAMDSQAPTMVCQNITMYLNSGGNASITGLDVDGGSTDACGIASRSVAPNSFTCADVGANPVTLTVTDVNGNAGTCAAIVTIADTTSPAAVCQNITVFLGSSGSTTITGNDVDGGSTDACGIASRSVTPNSFTCANVGVNQVTLTVTDVNANVSTCAAIVTVVDTTSPTAVCQNITVYLDGAGNASVFGNDIDNGSSDACGIAGLSLAPALFTCSNIGANPVTLTVTDVNANTNTCQAIVTVVDTVSPVVTCPPDVVVPLTIGPGDPCGPVPMPALGTLNATDACGVNQSANDAGLQLFDVPGGTTVTWTALDATGNSGTCTQNVSIQCTILFLDSDGDGITDDVDNCPFQPNPTQLDFDQDQVGDDCDNCPQDNNPLQEDDDQDGIGNVCDACPLAVDGLANFDVNTCNCLPGYFQTTAQIGQNTVITGCTACPAGTFCPDGIAAQPCPGGFYQDQTGQSQCAACGPGSYSDQLGSISCTLCPVNTYNPVSAATSCLACPAGETSGVGAIACTPNFDLCAGALPIACGQTVSGSTTGATVDGPACVGNSTAPGVWYTFTGANSGDPLALPGTPGDQVTMSTCNQAGYDTKLDVYTGSCGALVCVGGNDDAAGCAGFSSEFSFATTVGTTYYVMVSGFAANSIGNFDLTMTCAPPCLPVPLNDDCGSAEVLAVAPYGTGTPTAGDNTCAASALANPTCDAFANIQDVWFTFNSGAEGQVIISANGLSMTDLNLVVYEGACGGTQVFCQDPFNSPVLLTVTPGTDYYIQVYSDGPTGEGTFEIGVEALPPPPVNDDCAGAIPVACNSLTLGSTLSATANDAPATCTTSLNSAGGVWYTVTGWGGQMIATTCNTATTFFDTKLGVFDGSGGCASLVCVGGNDDAQPSGDPNCLLNGLNRFSKVTWTSTPGTTYYIYVTGFGPASGDFGLEVACGMVDPACTDNTVTLEMTTDGAGAEVSHTITGLGLVTAVSGQNGYPDNATTPVEACLPDGTYRLEVSDAGGNGITGGGYVLRDGNGNRIIDNAGNGDNFTSLSAMAPGRGFQLPVGPVTLYAPFCDREDLSSTATIRCEPYGPVSAQFGVNNATSGYGWRFFDPNGTYVRNIFISHANPSDPGKPAGAGRATWLRFQSIVTLPLPQNILLNVQVRPRVAGVYGNFGPVCRLVVDDVAANCPTTTLIQDVNNPFFSCGVQRVFGPYGNTISAQPVPGANRYRFRFEQIGDAFVRNIAIPGYTLTLNWGTLPLTPGASYNVFVQVSFDFGATYCPDGDPCVVDIISPGGPVDSDGDGFTDDADCDDNNNTVFPGNPEICGDGLDNNCNGIIDEGCPICGNGIVEPGEECDDGNLTNGDGCNQACVAEFGVGACCLPDGTCVILDGGTCGVIGGLFQGGGTDCATVLCPAPPTCTDGIQNGDEEGIDCGGSCPLSCEAAAFQRSMAHGSTVQLYPNPNRGDQFYLTIDELPNEELTVNVDIHDLFGKRVAARTMMAQGGMLNAVIGLDGQLAAGMYMVSITAGEQRFTERLVIE